MATTAWIAAELYCGGGGGCVGVIRGLHLLTLHGGIIQLKVYKDEDDSKNHL